MSDEWDKSWAERWVASHTYMKRFMPHILTSHLHTAHWLDAFLTWVMYESRHGHWMSHVIALEWVAWHAPVMNVWHQSWMCVTPVMNVCGTSHECVAPVIPVMNELWHESWMSDTSHECVTLVIPVMNESRHESWMSDTSDGIVLVYESIYSICMYTNVLYSAWAFVTDVPHACDEGVTACAFSEWHILYSICMYTYTLYSICMYTYVLCSARVFVTDVSHACDEWVTACAFSESLICTCVYMYINMYIL